MLKEYNEVLRYRLNLQFFAGDEKTEEPTERRKEKAREEGEVAKSVEVNTALLVIAAFFVLKISAKYMFDYFVNIFIRSFNLISQPESVLEKEAVTKLIPKAFGEIFLIIAPILIASMVVGVVANVIQVGWHPTTKAIAPKFNRLNPLEGFKRIFSKKAFIELLKSVGKFVLISVVIFTSIQGEVVYLLKLINVSEVETAIYVGDLVTSIAIKVGGFFLVIALADFIYQKRSLHKNLMMTKQEIKEEYKSTEGDPQIKQRIRQKMRQMSMQRMMQDVPRADVVITNPTHFAVAIRYEENSGKAPKVMAKGADYMAKRIKEIAKEHRIEIVENKPLARTLFATVEVGEEIPEELFQPVAEILAFVYKLREQR